MTPTVSDARPPLAVIRVLNPIMRATLRSPLGRLVRPFALLEFTGRRSGRRYRVPVSWHELDGCAVAFTPAPWRRNFAERTQVSVRYRGRQQEMTGTLVVDASEVAHALATLLARGTPPRAIGLKVATGHTMTASDVEAVDRAMIRFQARAGAA